jgi:hypothetical protein
MGTVAEKLRAELDKLAKEASDEETLREILKIEIRLQRGSFKGRAKPGPLTYEERERALLRLYRSKGWDTSLIEESIKKRKNSK